MSLNQFISYRLDALINIFISTGVWVAFNVLSMYFLTLKTGTVFGWVPGELILIACLYNVFIGIFGFLFVRNMNEFSELINSGRFDLILLKPIDSQFYTSTHTVGISSVIRTALGIGLAIFVCITFHIPIAGINIFLFFFSLIASLLLLYSLLFFLNTFIIWAPKLDNVNELFYTLRAMGRYPIETFKQLSEVFFVFASPFVIVLSTPTKILLGRATLYDISELVVLALVLFVATRLFWQFALRHYTSASS